MSANRDASLLFHDEEVARYYKQVFEFDWTHRAKRSIDETRPAFDRFSREKLARESAGIVAVPIDQLLDL